jgi:tRNA A-37 threonylcarbamoyl transferase component Bud32/Tol biopolymer transport system component
MPAVGTTLGPYTILAALGAGGMGEVYRAHDTRLGRDVAIKVIPPEFARDPDRIRRFEQEARAAAALNHPNVCAILDIGTYEDAPFIVMELLEGESLRHRLEQGAIPVSKAIEWTVEAARGLAAAHEKGIVHRDLKPENLFLTKDGRVKVLDFGLAKLTRPEVPASAHDATVTIAATETGAILGTVGYMAPEQVRGQPADARSDLFALGAILHELLTGKRAFHAASHVETLAAILNDEPPPLAESGRDVPPGLEVVVRHCMEKAPDDRFQTAKDLAFAVESMSAGAWGTTPRPAPSCATYTQLTVQRGRVSAARFAPDGRTVFYAAEWDGRPLEIFETRPGFPTSRAVGIADAGLLSISRGGTMAVLLGATWIRSCGTLAEVPISGGAPRRLLDDVGAADWLPDGKTLAVARRVGGTCRLEMPAGRVLYETSGDIAFLRVSGDGAWLTFADRPLPGDTRGSMIVMDASGRVAARTEEWNTIRGASWSADGQEVWYSPSNDLASTDLRALSPDGRDRVVARFPGMVCLWQVAPSGHVLLTRRTCADGIRGKAPSAKEERELGWYDWPEAVDVSADGATLLFDEQGVFGGPLYAVCLRGMDGAPPVKLGEGHARALSPDGKRALVLQWGPPQRLVLMPTGAGDVTPLPPGPIEKYHDARWLPDGKSVAFTGSEAGRAQRTYVQDVAGGPPSPVTPDGLVGTIVSPDGRSIVAVSADRRLHVCPLGGGTPRLVGELLPGEKLLQRSADGRSVYVGRSGTGMDVSRIELATGRRTPWRTFGLSDPAGVSVWSMALTPDGRSYAYTYTRILDDLYLVEGLV